MDLFERIRKRLDVLEKQQDTGFYAKAYREDVTELQEKLSAALVQIDELTAQRDAFGQRALHGPNR